MSYAPNTERIRATTTRAAGGHNADRERSLGRGGKAPAGRSRGRPYDVERDWALYAKVGLAIAAGAGIGAGVALLLTSETGPQRRAGLAKRARRMGHRAERAWSDLAFELGEAARGFRDRRRLRQIRAAEAETEHDD